MTWSFRAQHLSCAYHTIIPSVRTALQSPTPVSPHRSVPSRQGHRGSASPDQRDRPRHPGGLRRHGAQAGSVLQNIGAVLAEPSGAVRPGRGVRPDRGADREGDPATGRLITACHPSAAASVGLARSLAAPARASSPSPRLWSTGRRASPREPLLRARDPALACRVRPLLRPRRTRFVHALASTAQAPVAAR